mmetsp:Transcript_109266/g.309119  ORF Transcript_109266/g.309119 Transcript_109266/m.309119 type:complete len:367 (-) Transcript_109266:8-1108(-)
MLIFEFCVRFMWAVLLMMRSSAWTSSRYSGETRSVLFRRIRSAKATCSTASLTTPFGFSSLRCSMQCLASTTVSTPSRTMWLCTKSSAKNVCATGAGSARPVVSMMMPSRGLPLPAVCLWSFFSPTMRSPRTVQQMQPLFISMMFSSVTLLFVLSSASSIPISPNSFSMTAIRLPWFSSRMWFSSVVLPAPRKPVMMVVGTLLAAPAEAGSPAPFICASISVFSCSSAGSSGFRASAAARSTRALCWAPRPWRSAARVAYSWASCSTCSGPRLGIIADRKVWGARRMSPGPSPFLAPTRSSNVSRAAFTVCTPSKNFFAPSASRAVSSDSATASAITAPCGCPQRPPLPCTPVGTTRLRGWRQTLA